jgi:hypothetical protein
MKPQPVEKYPKFYKGKPCPDPIKGRRCSVCGKDYVCLGSPKPRSAISSKKENAGG